MAFLDLEGLTRFKQKLEGLFVKGPASSTGDHVATFNGTGGKTIKDSGYTIGKSVPSDAVFTDTTYTFDGTYNASTNKAATVSTVTNAINALDGNLNSTTPGAGKTLTAFSETNGVVSATFGNISITKSQVSDFPTSMTPTSHTHGNIQNGGTLQTNDVAIASGDKLVVTDSSDSNKVARTSLSFDGSTATKALTQKGTWESFTNNAGTITGITMNGASKGTSGVVNLGTVITSHQDISGKADKVSGATNGHLAGLDSNGNLTDSGKASSDFVASNQGSANEGKALVINSSGGVEPGDVAGGGDIIEFALDNVTNTSGSYTHTTTVSAAEATMKPVGIVVGNSAAFNANITITVNDGSITLSCPDVSGTSTVTVQLLTTSKNASTPTVTSQEFNVLDGRIGTLSSLTTTAKTSTVAAINELNTNKAGASSHVSVTALATGWSNSTPPQQTINVTGVTASNNIYVSAGIVDTAQYQVLANAQIQCIAQAAGTITLACYGEKPTVNLPIEVLIMG